MLGNQWWGHRYAKRLRDDADPAIKKLKEMRQIKHLPTTSGGGAGEEDNEYERQRMSRIERNQAVLRSLGLPSATLKGSKAGQKVRRTGLKKVCVCMFVCVFLGCYECMHIEGLRARQFFMRIFLLYYDS